MCFSEHSLTRRTGIFKPSYFRKYASGNKKIHLIKTQKFNKCLRKAYFNHLTTFFVKFRAIIINKYRTTKQLSEIVFFLISITINFGLKIGHYFVRNK